MQLSTSESNVLPIVLDSLPTPSVADGFCPRRSRMQIDLLLLAIEALDSNGSEAILGVARELGLTAVLPDRVTLWRLRGTNPLRKLSPNRELSIAEGKSLVIILCYLARRLTVVLRQYVLTQQQLEEKSQPLTDDFYLATYLERFQSHFQSRMSTRRSATAGYESPESIDQLALQLLSQLLFCTGTSGMQRLWTSLFDGEV